MPCLALPAGPIRDLPYPFTLGPPPPPPLPTLPAGICCKLPVNVTPPPTPSIPGVVIGPLASLISGAVKAIHEYLDNLALECPRE